MRIFFAACPFSAPHAIRRYAIRALDVTLILPILMPYTDAPLLRYAVYTYGALPIATLPSLFHLRAAADSYALCAIAMKPVLYTRYADYYAADADIFADMPLRYYFPYACHCHHLLYSLQSAR